MKKNRILPCLAFGAVALLLTSCAANVSEPTNNNTNVVEETETNDPVEQKDPVVEEQQEEQEEKTPEVKKPSFRTVQDEPILKLAQEKIEDGIENCSQDTGWQNVETSFSLLNKFGDTSKASLMAKPVGSKNNKLKYFVSFFVQRESSVFQKCGIDFKSGILTFDYLPINLTNPENLILYAVKSDWSTDKAVNVTCQPTKDGWYRCAFDLSSFGFSDDLDVIRFNIGFDVSEENKSSARIYLDNMKVSTKVETVDDSLENMARDTGWEKCNVERDYCYTANSKSINSYKLTFNGKSSDVNKNFICLSPQNQKLDIKCNEGVLEAKFRFSDETAFATKKILLVLVDSGWSAARTKIDTTPIGDGWYLFKVDLSNMTYGSKDTNFDPSKNLIRLGFGFPDLTSDNKDDKAVWIDDVKLSPKDVTTSGVNVWQAYNTETILQTETVSGRDVTTSTPLNFEELRNATDSTQLMISPTEAITSFNFEPQSLYNNNGDVLKPEIFEVLVAKYIYVGTKSIEHDKEGWKGEGYYPDALVPIQKIIDKGENSVAANTTQSIWLNASIPTDQTPGDYTGYGVLTINGVKYSVPMKVKVHNATLPQERHNKSCFLCWDDQTLIGEGEINYDMRVQYYIDALSKGINHGELRDLKYGTSADFADKFYQNIANDPRVTTYRLPINKDDEGNVDESQCLEVLDALIAKNIEVWDSGNHVNFFDKLIFYVNDEPLTPDGTSAQDSDTNKKSIAQWACVKNNNDVIKRCKETLKSKLADYLSLYESFTGMRNVLPMDVAADKISGGTYKYGWLNTKTGKYPNYFNTDYMDTPCPAFHHLTDESVRTSYATTFKHTWFYGCLLPQLPYPGYHIDNNLLNERLITWMQYDYNFEGSVYWVTNFYQQDATGGGWVDRDVWTDSYTCGSCCGDGTLSYPGQKYNVFGPITTLRYETIRNSMKDYEYFALFDTNISNYKSKTGSSVNSAREYLASAYAEMFNGTAVKSSYYPNSFENVRIDLLNQLDLGC